MKVIDLDGQEHTLKLSSNPINRAKLREGRSSYHLAAREMLCEMFVSYYIIEEVPIKINRGTQLYLDFFIPLLPLAVEVHGEQHYTYVKHFHRSKLNFLKQKRNDSMKAEWCHLNSIRLVVLKWDEQHEWGTKI
jgi:very-short-patch-repair endonuclease